MVDQLQNLHNLWTQMMKFLFCSMEVFGKKKSEYEYMQEYYQNVIACPVLGYVIVAGRKLNAQILR